MKGAQKLNKINKYLLIIFFMLQPILELILSTFKNDKFTIAGMSIATLIRYGLLAVIIFIAVISNIKRKSTKMFIGLLVLYAVYIALHYINIRNFDSVILGTSMSKGFVTVAMYVSKFIVPVSIIYLVFILRFNYKDMKVCVLFVASFVALLIIITNLFGTDYVAYSFEDNPHLAGNIIKWFDKDFLYDDWRLLTSRGLYASGNELSSFFVVLLPIVFWISLKEKKSWYFVIALVQMISMLLIGTRISVYGAIILSVATLIIWFIHKLMNKQKIEKRKILFAGIVLIIFGIFFSFSPFMNRIKAGEGTINNYTTENKDKKKPKLSKEDNTPDRIFIKKNYSKELIPYSILTDTYNYLEHTEFWVHIINDVDMSKRNNSRKLKTLILDDIEKNKDGKTDKLVGIGEIPIYPERDFVAQYYYIGVLGIILFFAPFVIILIISLGYNFIKFVNKQLDGFQIVLILSLLFTICTAYLAGHVLEPIYINSFIGLVTGMLLIYLTERSKKESIDENGIEKYIKKMYKKGKENFICELENKIKNDEKAFIVTANPETFMIANSNPEFDKCLMDLSTVIIPDGIGVVKGAKMLGYDMYETITGVDLCEKIFEFANSNNKSIYLFGAKEEVVQKLKNKLEKDYPKIKILGIQNGYVEDKQKTFDYIKTLKPDIVLVALGIPCQELLIYNNYKDFEHGIFMGVGGSFDVLSGTKKRAPKFLVNAHLEWLYRIIKEPNRLGRFFNSNIKYVFKIIKEH